jgi:hypothetical protein
VAAAVLDRQAAKRHALIRRQQRVALDNRHAVHRHRQFLGGDLRHRGLDAGAEIDLAGIHGHVAPGIDGEETVHLIEGDGLGERGLTCRPRGAGCAGAERKGDDECATGLQEVAPRGADRSFGNVRSHSGLLTRRHRKRA